MALRAACRTIALAAIALCALPRLAGATEQQQIRSALAWARPILGTACDISAEATRERAAISKAFDIRYRDPGQDQDSPDRRLTLFQLACGRTSGNTNFVFVTKDDDGYSLVSFALPQLDYDYADETFSALTSPPRLIGYRTTFQLANAAFDPATRSMSMHAKWNDRDDAWSAGTWQFINGYFVLSRFDVDPTYARHEDAASGHSSVEPDSYRIFPDANPGRN